MASFTGAVVLVTGALGGLGGAIVDGFAGHGATIALHHVGQRSQACRRAEELRRVGLDAMCVEADITDWEQTEAAIAQVVDAYGRIDVLVNNAGYLASSRFADTTLEEWGKTIDIDLTGTFIVSRHTVPVMQRHGSGVIVNTSSQLAYKGAVGYAAYCAAKAGVVGLTHAMARELGPHIRVNAVAPGPIETPLITPFATEDFRESRTRDLVARRLGTPEEVACAVIFLASPEATYVHGQVLHVNGGGVMS